MWLFNGFIHVRTVEDEQSRLSNSFFGRAKYIDLDSLVYKKTTEIQLPKHKKYRLKDLVEYKDNIYTIKDVMYYSNSISYNLRPRNSNADLWVAESRLKSIKRGI
jgi:lipopolysaccharide export LptBFGC system permease protein LptF